MIASVKEIEPENDNYARLAKYIADKDHAGEKTLASWCAGCLCDDDYDLAIQEVVDTQALNTRTKKAKTYHLVLSFHPEDEQKLDIDDYKNIEQKFAQALGFSHHQRHAGIHKNTNNIHEHIAYNMISPELTRLEPFQDYVILSKVCRQVEREYGLKVDRGMGERSVDDLSLSSKAAAMESHSGQQSFEGYVKALKPQILAGLAAAKDWEDIHKNFAKYGMELKRRGNGLIIKNRHGKHAIKASSLDRSLSMMRLEDKFGSFTPYRESFKICEEEKYTAAPVQKNPYRGQLYQDYKEQLQKKIPALKELKVIKQNIDDEAEIIRLLWDKKRKDIYNNKKISTRDRYKLLQEIIYQQKKEISALKKDYSEIRYKIYQEFPFSSWADYLKIEALGGNNTAIDILRSKHADVNSIQHNDVEKFKQRETIKENYHKRKNEILQSDKMVLKDKKKVLTLLKVKYLQDITQTYISTDSEDIFTIEIDNTGVIIFKLSSGGTVRDDGKRIMYSKFDPSAGDLAREYAHERWGKRVIQKENSFICIPKDKKTLSREI